jgi:hypothetical protein
MRCACDLSDRTIGVCFQGGRLKTIRASQVLADLIEPSDVIIYIGGAAGRMSLLLALCCSSSCVEAKAGNGRWRARLTNHRESTLSATVLPSAERLETTRRINKNQISRLYQVPALHGSGRVS